MEINTRCASMKSKSEKTYNKMDAFEWNEMQFLVILEQ